MRRVLFVQAPLTSPSTFNFKSAKALGLMMPQPFLLRAN
jgi:hypothetical protein